MPKAEIMQRAGLGAAQFELFRSPLRHYMEREFDKQLIAVPGDSAKTKPAVNNLLPGERVDFRKVRP